MTGCSAGATFSAGGGAAHPAVRRNRWRPCQGPAVHRSDGMPRAGQTLGPVDESPGPPFPSLEDTARPFLSHRMPGMERPGQAGRMSSLSRNAGSAWSRPARRAEGSSLRTERIERYAQHLSPECCRILQRPVKTPGRFHDVPGPDAVRRRGTATTNSAVFSIAQIRAKTRRPNPRPPKSEASQIRGLPNPRPPKSEA